MGMNFDELLKGTSMDENTKKISDSVLERKVIISLNEFMDKTSQASLELFNGKDKFMNALSTVVLLPEITEFVAELSMLLFIGRIDEGDIYSKIEFRIVDFLAATNALFSVPDSKTHGMIERFPEIKDMFKTLVSMFLAIYFGDDFKNIIADAEKELKERGEA